MYVSVSERFVKCAEYLIETRKLRNQAELVRLLGLSKGYVSQLMSGKREPSETIVSNLCARFPELNAQWIMTGAGEMTQEVSLCPVEEFIEPNTVPMLPIFAQAGHLTEWSEGIEEAKCERVISPVKDIDMAIYIKRDQRKVDEANRKVIDYIKGTVPHLTT